MKGIHALLLALILGTVVPTWASLGDDVSSVDNDVQTLHAKRVIMAKDGYNLHQMTLPNGGIVNEYVSPAGMVFGVAWQGQTMPNLYQLLGSYMTELQQGQRTNVVRRRAVIIHGDNFEFSSIGHARYRRGRAYVPGLVPTTVSPEVVQ